MKRPTIRPVSGAVRALAVSTAAVGLTAALATSASAAQQEFWYGGNHVAIDNSPGSGASWAWINDEDANSRAACVEMYFTNGWTGQLCDRDGAYNNGAAQGYTGGDVVRFRMYEEAGGSEVPRTSSVWHTL